MEYDPPLTRRHLDPNRFDNITLSSSSTMSEQNMRPSTGRENGFGGERQNSQCNDRTTFTKLRSKNSHGIQSFIYLGLIFICAVLILYVLYVQFPKLDKDEVQYVKLPRNIEDAKNLGRVLSRYNDKHFKKVIGGYFIIYIFLQTFAIPGSIFLSIIAGYLFSFPLALFAVCLCSSLGASFCYSLSYLVGNIVVKKFVQSQKVDEWKKHVERNREHLLNYIIFLRITPFLPNWFINITSPVIDVPLFPFALGTFIGVAPPSFVAIHAGTMLQKLTSSSDAWSWTSMIVLAVLAISCLLIDTSGKHLTVQMTGKSTCHKQSD
ncbi:unnamed protein product [Owenia fusiformis]|uniref:Uncharacterized protein n=1 Tax=Owenia fusiformis TaxID=6347 RepID=A0A8J1TZS0_OWEFU|nr:unnamed protein product [Owenia fusiformis]